MRTLLALPVLVLLVLFPARAQQNNPLVGAWSTQTRMTTGESTGAIFTTFSADGQFRQRWVIPGATIDYVGNYQLSPDRSSLRWLYRDYNPKTVCRGGGSCYPVQPVVQMNAAFVTPLRWVRDNLFITEDRGGALQWVRQS